jgi:hypothetical protein
MTKRLSKSKLIAFRQCPKRMWLEVHRPDLRIDDSSAQGRFEAGHQVGALAQTQYPDGVLIAPDNNLTQALKDTKAELARSPRRVLFEATFQAADILVRADLLIPTKKGWHMVEVKSSTSVKDYHLEDAAIQTWVAKQAGLTVSNTSLQVIDSSWTYPGGNNYSGLLRVEALDESIGPIQPEVPNWIAAAQKIAGSAEPAVKMGSQCNSPFACGFQEYCLSLTKPVKFPISWLPNLHHTKRAKFEAAGFSDLRHIDVADLSEKQQRVWQATVQGEVYFEPLSKSEAKLFEGTRYYLDFETINFTVPIWAGTRPYQQVPFQWSCHIEADDGVLSHEMFLDLTGNDPSRSFAESLLKALGRSGPIVVYNQAFEKRIIKELAERFDDLAPKLTKLLDRVVDLLPLANAHFYAPSMQGSWSIKSVLPAINPALSYAGLVDVAEGGAAQDAYSEAISTATDLTRKAQLRAALEAYCARDTEAMIVVLHFLLSGKVLDGPFNT